jgi:hypothetical protein
MSRRSWALALALALSFAVGHVVGSRQGLPAVLPGVAPAYADGALQIDANATFVSTHEGNAYLWRREGDRLVLVSQCVRLEGGSDGQATYVSLPGVERGS